MALDEDLIMRGSRNCFSEFASVIHQLDFWAFDFDDRVERLKLPKGVEHSLHG